MLKLNFPEYSFKIIKREKNFFIFDIVRKKYVKLTPEEWVRQHTLRFFINEKKFPASLVEVEKTIEVNNQNLRIDILFNNAGLKPQIIVECKAPHIKINQRTADQLFTYNTMVKAPYLLLTNGITHFFYFISQDQKIQLLKNIPDYSDLV